MSREHFLVTGATGCIGAWVVRQLLSDGVAVTALSAHGRLDRLALLLSDEELAGLDRLTTDINDLAALESEARRRGITHIVHLAALQFPFCAADPIEGARVNVQGTLTAFELGRRLEIGRLVYASSAAVFGPRSNYGVDVVPADAALMPTSYYGTYKLANEGAARVAWETQQICSVGLRPHSVYGPGRDQGVSSKPTVAMIAAAAGRPYRIDFSGRYQFQFARDVADWFIAAARSDLQGAFVYSLPGPLIGVDEIVAAIGRVEPASRDRISFTERLLPFASGFESAPLEMALGSRATTDLASGVEETIERYRSAIRRGRLDDATLDRVLAS